VNKAAINWAEVYNSLNINTHKQAGKWILRAILVVGAIPVAAAFLVFRHQPEIGLMITGGIIIIVARLQWGIVKLNRKPKVVVGSVAKRSAWSYINKNTRTRTIRHYISIKIENAFEVDCRGMADTLSLANKQKNYECPSDLYNSVIEGQSLTAVVMPHDNSISRIF
jgi:hypothetical protein